MPITLARGCPDGRRCCHASGCIRRNQSAQPAGHRQRVIYSNNRYRLNETKGCADLIIDVPVEAFGLLDFDKYEEIVELGYTAAKEQLKGFHA